MSRYKTITSAFNIDQTGGVNSTKHVEDTNSLNNSRDSSC